MNVKAPLDAVTDAVSQAEATMPPGAFIASASGLTNENGESMDKTTQVKCKEGQDEVFDNCIRDDSPSKEATEE